MSWEFISNLLLASVRMATPLIFLALAELYSQRAGLVHIGLEGLASIGSLVGFLVSLITGNPFLGVLAGAAAGILVNMIYAYATITLCAEQIVYGMAINIAFALLNGAADTPAKAENGNVSSLLPNATQIGWIAGALAGLMTENGTIAFIGGMELDTTKGKYEGYKEAAAYVAEKAGKTATTLDIVYSNSFSASDKGIEFAKAMIDKGADVFFGDASAVDSGARQAIDEYNAAQGSVKVFDIAQPADLLGQNECIICSQVTDNSAMVGSCMEAVEAGKLGGDVIYGTLENGALSAGAVSDLVPAEIKDQYNAYIEEMKAGTFMK